MSSNTDTLSTLAENLKQKINEIQERYESFIDSNQLYKQGKIDEREFFASIGDYLVASSAMNFITVKTIFEIKSTVEKKGSNKPQPGTASFSSVATSSEVGLGMSKPARDSQMAGAEQFSLPKPQQPAFSSLQIDKTPRSTNGSENKEKTTKDCVFCGRAIPKQAKFCTRCGSSQ